MCRRKTRPSIADFPSAVKRTATCMAKKTPSTLKRPRKAVQWISGQTTFTGGRSASLSWATVSYRTTNPSSTHSTAAEAPSVSTKWKSWWALQGEGGYVYVLCLALSRLPAKVMTWGRLNLQLPPHGLITVLFQLRGALFFFSKDVWAYKCMNGKLWGQVWVRVQGYSLPPCLSQCLSWSLTPGSVPKVAVQLQRLNHSLKANTLWIL